MKLEDFANKNPEFKLEEYFLGKTTANGLFIDLFGKVKRQFTVEMEGIQEGDVFILNETFLYDNGEASCQRSSSLRRYCNQNAPFHNFFINRQYSLPASALKSAKWRYRRH